MQPTSVIGNIGGEKMVDATFSFSRAIMAGSLILSVIACIRGKEEYIFCNSVGSVINTISFVHHDRMYSVYAKYGNVWYIRFFDWLVTTPLTVVVLHSFSGMKLWTSTPGAGLAVIMILFGAGGFPFDGNKIRSVILTFLAFLCLIGMYVIFAINVTEITETTIISIFFFIIWFLYGIAFMMKGGDVTYNILDVLSKCGMVLTIATYSLLI